MLDKLSGRRWRYAIVIALAPLVAPWFSVGNGTIPKKAVASNEQIDEPSSRSVSTRKKFALLVGISKYDRGNKVRDIDWWDLHTKGDLEIIAAQLISKFQFEAENVKILSDTPVTVGERTIGPVEQVTGQLIRETFRSALTNNPLFKPGDVAYFHFSGHGQQVPDDGDDELDGYDETLVPSDYVSQKDGSRNLRDDDIALLLDELSKKGPSNVTITLDSCFSGTATRGDLPPRGGEWRGKPVDPSKVRGSDENAADFVTRSGSRGGPPTEQKYVFISAASPRQTAKETWEDGKPYGAFSFALAKAMERAGERTTYRDLFNMVTDAVTSKQRDQSPQMEGSHVDKILMEDGAVPPQRFVAVKTTRAGKPYLTAGRLQGMTKGSRFALYPADAKEHVSGKELAIAKITSVSPTTSMIEIDGNAAIEKLALAARAFEISHSYEDILKVAIANPGRGGPDLERLLNEVGLASRVAPEDKSWNVLIRPANAEDEKFGVKDVNGNAVKADFKGVILQRPQGKNDFVIAAIPDGPNSREQIKNALLAEGRWLTIKSLAETSDAVLAKSLEFEIFAVDIEFNDAGEALSVKDKPSGIPMINNAIVFTAGKDFVKLRLRNTGTKPIHVTILNLMADGKIKKLFPMDNAENRIEAGRTYEVPYPIRVKEPLGNESYVAIATEIQTDFSPLLDVETATRGDFETERARNAANSPLGRILRAASTGKRSEIGSAPATWATKSINFLVTR